MLEKALEHLLMMLSIIDLVIRIVKNLENQD